MAFIPKNEPVTHEWLRSRGFRICSTDADNKPHMVLVMEHRNETALELTESYDGRWIVWLRSDLAHARCRFCFMRDVRTTDQVERLVEAITDKPLLSVEWDPVQFAEGLRHAREEAERHYKEYCRKERWGHIPGT